VPRRAVLPAFLVALLALLASCPAAGAAARTVPTGFFGMNWDKDIRYHSSSAIKQDAWDRMAEIGVESQRATFNWSSAQFYGRNQDIDWKVTDSVVLLAAKRHIRLLPVVMQAPPWARSSRNKDNSPPKSPKPYTKYLTAAIKRYGPDGTYWKNHPKIPKMGLRDWQIWNEPSEDYQWDIPSDRDWAPGYAKLLKAAYEAAKQADEHVRVVLAGLPSRSWESLAHLYDVGGIHGYFDIAAVHPYTASAHGPLTIVRYFRTVMRQNHDSKKPVLVTETTLPASKGKATSKGQFETTDAGMAAFVKEVYRDMIKNRKKYRIGGVYWYTWASDYEGWTFDFTGLVKYRRGDLVNETEEMPAYDEYRKAALRAAGCSKDATGACVGPPP
jgi:Glycosyl hydrolase family 53